MAATLATLGDDRVDAHLQHLLGVAAGAHGGHHEHAGVVAAGDGVLGRRAGEAHQPHALGHDVGDALVEIRLVGAEVDAEGAIGSALHLGDLLAELLGRHGDSGEDAEAAGGTRRGRQPGAGDPAHARLHDRQIAADQVAEAGPQRI